MKIARTVIVTSALVTAVFYGFVGGAESRPVPQDDGEAKTEFADRCAKCHGADGMGKTPLGESFKVPNFTDTEWQKGVTNDRMRESTTKGRDNMPAFGTKLSKAKIDALILHVRGFSAATEDQ